MSFIGLSRTINTIIIALSLASTCSFGGTLFSPVSGLTNANVAAIWSTTAGGTTKIANGITVNFYTAPDTGCTTTPTVEAGVGPAFIFHPSSIYSANATGLYDLCTRSISSATCQSYNSVQIIPTSSSANVFTSTPCFAIIYSSGRLVYAGGSKSVTLQA